MINKLNKPSKNAFKALSWIIRTYLEYRSDIEVEINETLNLEPPYLVISNHVNNWDPFLINSYIDEPISYVAGDRFFRSFITRSLLNYTGAIKKTKFKSDLYTVRRVIQAKKEGRIIGIFPEGSRNWDGTTKKILYPTAKLIKLLKIPVVVVQIKGAYLSFPRWSYSHRKGKIKLSFKKLMDKEQIKIYDEDNIYCKMADELNYSEYDFQRQNKYVYRGEKLAERLELLLFTCPHCKQIGEMRSKYNDFFCTKCGYRVMYTNEGFFIEKSDILYFDNPRDWNAWQLNLITSVINDKVYSAKDSKIHGDKGAILYRDDGKTLKKINHGEISIDSQRIYFTDINKKEYRFDISSLSGINVQSNDKLEFYYEDDLYRIAFNDVIVSAYKWMKILNNLYSISKRNNKDRKEVNYG